MRLLALLCLMLLTAMPAMALDPPHTGVVVMHGKWGNPGGMRPLCDELEAAGFLVEAPEMAWSGRRLYDRPYEESLTEIDAAILRLKQKGASHVVVAGHSLGGNAALGYSALGREVAALVLLAPAHSPEGKWFRERAASDVAKARALVAEGKGAETAYFTSWNSGDRSRSVSVGATAFLSFYDPEGPAAMSRLAPKVGAAPILWLAPTTDPTTEGFARNVWPQVQAENKTRLDIAADHMGVVMAGRVKLVEWLKGLQ
jgi:dienelactone hydrolase